MMPYITIKGIGEVEVDRLPKRIPKKVTIYGREYPVDEEMYMLTWAINHATPEARAKIKLIEVV